MQHQCALFDFDELSSAEEEARTDSWEQIGLASRPVLVFYDSWQSSCAWRVRLALTYKELDYETRHALSSTEASSQSPVRDASLNPMRQVPFLMREGWEAPLGQSVAICEYLDEAFPLPPLLPGSPRTRAKLREMVECVNSFVQPKQPHGFKRGLAALEALASRRKATQGPFLGGRPNPSLADFFLVPQLGNARSANIDLSLFPTLLHSEAALKSHPVYEKSHPKGVLLAAQGLLKETKQNVNSTELLMSSRWPGM